MLIPDHFEVKQKLLTSTGIDMKLKANGTKIGYIKQTHVSTGRQFQLINKHKDLIAIARKYIMQNGAVMEIFDELNYKVGSIQRQIFRNSGALSEKYVIRNGVGEIIAQTGQLANIRDSVEFYDAMNVKIGDIRLTGGKLSKGWDTQIYGHVDRRLLVFVPLFVANQLDIKCM